MMKKANLLFRLLAAACLICSLAACGSGSASPEKSAEVQESSVVSQSASPTERPTALSESASGSASESVSEPPVAEPQEAGTNVLVAYFSATGTTKGVAEQIAAITGGSLYEIVPAQPYTAADLDYNNGQSRTSLEKDDPAIRPEIGSEEIVLDEYTTLYLGYPIWNGQAPRIMSTFVESYDFDGITVIPFCTSGGSGIGSSGETLAQQAGSGSWLAGERFGSGVAEADLQAWIDGLNQ